MSNFIKTIFIILIIGIVIFLSVIIFKNRENIDDRVKTGELSEEENYQDDLRLAVADFDTFNPILSKNRNIYEISKSIYEPLIELDMNYRKQYCLAEKIEQRNDTQYVVYLREAKWHDGTFIKSEDFHFTIKMINSTNSIYKENIEQIASVKSVTSSSFIITLKNPVKYFEYKLTFPVMKKIEEKTFKNKNTIPQGTGLFKYRDTKNNVVTFDLNEEYWNKDIVKQSKFKAIYVYKYGTIGEVYNAFKSGNIDIINCLNNRYTNQIGTYGYIDSEYKHRDFSFMAINTKKVNKNVRKAISLSLDKSKLVTELGKGITYSPFPTDFGHWSYPQVNKLEYNLTEAKKILTSNGYKLKNGKWTDSKNKTLSYQILVNANNTTQLKTADKISKSLNKFGIETTVRKRYGNTYYAEIRKRNYDLAIVTRRNGFDPSIEAFLGNSNYSNYNHNEVKELLKQAESENDEEKFLEIYNKIYNIYLEDIPFIGLYRNTRRIITSLGLHMDSVPNSYNMLYNLSKWYRK